MRGDQGWDTTCNDIMNVMKKTGKIILVLSWVVFIPIVLAATIPFPLEFNSKTPKDIGSSLEYIGKKEQTCTVVSTLIFFCNPNVPDTYYYATDMSQDQLKTYFKKAKYDDYPNANAGKATTDSQHVGFILLKDSEVGFGFDFYNYDNAKAIREDLHLKASPKANILRITEGQYDLAQESL